MIKISSYCDDGSGGDDEYAGLQLAANRVSESNRVLDLEGGTWRHDSKLTFTGRCTIINGVLKGSVVDTLDFETNHCVEFLKGGENYARPNCDGVIFERAQYANKVGVLVERGLEVRFDRCEWRSWEQNGCIPLRILSVTGGNFDHCFIDGYGVNGIIITARNGQPASTDLGFDKLRLVGGWGANANAAVEGAGTAVYMPLKPDGSVGSAGHTFSGGGVEDTSGHAFECVGTRRIRWVSGFRFEEPGAGFSLCRITNPGSDPLCDQHTLKDISMSGGDGVTPRMHIGSGVDGTAIKDSHFPSTGNNLESLGTNTKLEDNTGI